MNRKSERLGKALCFVNTTTALLALLLLAGRNWGPVAATAAALALGVHLYLSRRWMISPKKGVAVLTFHAVTDHPGWLPWPYLGVARRDFENLLRRLKRRGYRTVSLHRVRDHIRGVEPLPDRCVCLTFDDGYLDNWVNACPLMKQYGFKGTLFMAADFIDPEGTVRPNREDLRRGRVRPENLEERGYLSAGELRRMGDIGIMDVQCHTASHGWSFTASTPTDFVTPGDPRAVWYFWALASGRPADWHLRLQAEEADLWGHALFPFQRSLLVKRAFHPDPRLNRRLNRQVRRSGGRRFFRNRNWRETLQDLYQRGVCEHPGRWESPSEAVSRVDRELRASKTAIEAITRRPVAFLCWPGDRFTPGLLALATGPCGYAAASGGGGRNTGGEDPRLFSRMYVKHQYTPFNSGRLNVFLCWAELKAFEGNFYWYLVCICFHALNLMQKFIHRKALRGI